MPRINQRASFTELLSVQSSNVIQHKTPLSRPQQNAQLLEEAAADMVGRQETGDWRQWYPYPKLYVRVLWVLSEHQSKTSPRASGHRSNLSQPLLFSHKHNSSQLLLLSPGKRGSPPSVRGRAHPPCTLGLQRSLWEDVNSAPSLPQKRVTRDLLDPWSRAWSTGAVGKPEVKVLLRWG